MLREDIYGLKTPSLSVPHRFDVVIRLAIRVFVSFQKRSFGWLKADASTHVLYLHQTVENAVLLKQPLPLMASQ